MIFTENLRNIFKYYPPELNPTTNEIFVKHLTN